MFAPFTASSKAMADWFSTTWPRSWWRRPARTGNRDQGPHGKSQRIQKALEDAGIPLDSVASEVLGVSGRATLVAGESV